MIAVLGTPALAVVIFEVLLNATAMTIGIDAPRDLKACGTLWGMLALPFVGQTAGYAINRRE